MRIGHKIVSILDEILTETKTWKDWLIIVTLLGTLASFSLLAVTVYVLVVDRNRIYAMFEAEPRLEQRIENIEIEAILQRRLNDRPNLSNFSVIVYYFDRRSVRALVSVGSPYLVGDRFIIDDNAIHSSHLSNACITIESSLREDTYRTSCPIVSPYYGLEGYLVAVFNRNIDPNEDMIKDVELFLREIVLILT